MEKIIEAKNLTKVYGEDRTSVIALNNVNLDFYEKGYERIELTVHKEIDQITTELVKSHIYWKRNLKFSFLPSNNYLESIYTMLHNRQSLNKDNIIIRGIVNGELKKIDAEDGLTLMEVARDNDLGIEGTCGGSISCCTCHVVIEKDWFGKVGPANPDEEDMLDLAVDLQPTSRLGCQIEVTPELDGLIVNIPNE